jgi:hypothetical protein
MWLSLSLGGLACGLDWNYKLVLFTIFLIEEIISNISFIKLILPGFT